MAEMLLTVFVVSRCSSTLTHNLPCDLLTLGLRSTLPAGEDQFQKFSSHIRLCVTFPWRLEEWMMV